MNFKTGKLIITRSVNDLMAESKNFCKEILSCLNRHLNMDWGILCDEDKSLNDEAVKSNEDRILSKYKTSEGNIYIITEWNRSYTTVLFCNEY